MVRKNKNSTSTSDQISKLAAQGGFLLMAAAATLGVAELPHQEEKRRMVLPAQPAYATINQVEPGDNAVRREKDEVHPHPHTFTVASRTPGRAGRI
jgi:hypothetical protein